MSHKILRLVSRLFLALAVLGSGLNTQVARAAGPWYVTPTGDDNNDCLSSSTPCGTINGAIGKATAGDTVNAAVGTYTGTGAEVVLVDRDITLSGGWNASFTTQSGMSTIDGQSSRQGVLVDSSITSVTATVEHFTIQNGTAGGRGGGIRNYGSTLALNNTIVSNNVAEEGGGISNEGTMTINNSSISGNTSTVFSGGGISNSGNLSLNNSTVSGNSSPGSIVNSWGGGGISNASFGSVVLNNSTVSANVTAVYGGGIFNYGGPVTVNNSTISNNTAQTGGGIFNNSGSLGSAVITLQNTIVASNTDSNATTPDCTGDINSSGYNIIGNASGCNFIPANGDLTGIDPLLGSLQDNGGPTFTHALLPLSLAIDAGNPAGCTDQNGNPLTTDQRGVTRPQSTRCDIGAFELEATAGGGTEVSIDIKPGSQSNPINSKSSGKTPVAILSKPDFDAPSEVDKTSLTFGRTGDEPSLVFCNIGGEDVNGDGLLDLVCHFKTKLTSFKIGDTEGILKGQTVDGISIEGRDALRILK